MRKIFVISGSKKDLINDCQNYYATSGDNDYIILGDFDFKDGEEISVCSAKNQKELYTVKITSLPRKLVGSKILILK